jgi:hypothetical protein
MSDMVRKQIYISRRQQTLLRHLSEQRGLSEAEIVRQAIDREALVPASQAYASDEQSWQEALAFMRSLRERADQFSGPYHWNREELYEERLRIYQRETDGLQDVEDAQ